MSRMKKEFDSNGTFQRRFRILYNENCTTQKELAIALNVSRQTIAGWLLGKSLPDIDVLVNLAQYYHVSADYLLGLSDMRTPDMSQRAAAEYTGLSEEAVERLHGGFNYPADYDMERTDADKEEYLRVASALISSHEFEDMVSSLKDAAKWAYLESALLKFRMQRSEAAVLAGKTEPKPISKEERGKIMAELLRVLQDEGFFVPEHQLNRVQSKIVECLEGDGLSGLLDIRESLDRQQFLASKAIMAYLEQLVKNSRQQAKQRFGK